MKGFLYENRNSNTFLTYKMQPGDELETFSLGMVTNNKIPGLLPLLFTQMNEERQFMYNVTSKVSLRQYMSGKMTQTQCVRIFAGIADAFLACEDYMLSTSVLLTEPEFIFMNAGTGEALLVCLPLAERPELKDIPGYFKSILTGMVFAADGNMDYPAKIINALNAGGSFSLAGFRQFLKELQPFKDPDTVTMLQPNPGKPEKISDTDSIKDANRVNGSLFRAADQVKSTEREGILHFITAIFKKRSEAYVSAKTQSGAKQAAADVNFAVPGFNAQSADPVRISKKISERLDFGETTYLTLEEEPDETVLLKEYAPPDIGGIKPFLIRVKTNEKIIIDDSVFKIGKEKSYVNYFVADNAAVSRSHADIVKLEGAYYIVDNNSTNHTYLNGQIIRSNENIPLEDGSIITLGSEEFEFHCI